MPTTTAADLVVLKGGLVVPVVAVTLLLDLERRGLSIRVDAADGAIVCRPGRLLTAEDKGAIAAYRDQLRGLIRYCEGLAQ
ncbi:MAG: hypothetical protein M3545_18635 [Acidobacteriota bacterium]|nr:hypothetical protein [Acidobacteriota bacterium]